MLQNNDLVVEYQLTKLKFPASTIVHAQEVLPWHLLSYIVVTSLDGLKKNEIEMKPNQAYETVTRPQPATQVHVEPDYEDVVIM